MEFERSRQIKMHLDIAPLIDIVFLLLIFFMLTANFIMQPGIKITLPVAKSSRPQENRKITIFISESNEIYLDDEQISIDILGDALRNRLETVEKKVVILKADEKINLGLAVKTMDIAKEAGSEDVVIATDLNPEGTGGNASLE
jgi:biopolymer transport protein ExbD